MSNVQVASAHYNDDTETDGEHSLCWQQVRVFAFVVVLLLTHDKSLTFSSLLIFDVDV